MRNVLDESCREIQNTHDMRRRLIVTLYVHFLSCYECNRIIFQFVSWMSWVYSHPQTVMETSQHQLPWCLRWYSRCIGGLRPQQRWLNRWWPYTKEQVKFHPVQLKDVHTTTLQPRLKFAYFFSTKPEFAMPSGNLLHVSRGDRRFSESC